MALSWGHSVCVLLAAVLCLQGSCYSEQAPNYTFVHDAATAPEVSYYDYIVVGGGTAGCPLAATLSQNFSVLLLERGGSPYGNPNITNLASFGVPLADTSPSSPSQRFISEERVYNARAQILGGGTCLNAGFYSRASTDFVNNVSWDASLVEKSYRWVEKMVEFRPPMLQWQSAFKAGLLEVGVTPDNGYTLDHIIGTKVGGTIFDKNGHRHTAADLLEYANPQGLTVLLHATVNRILFRTKGRKKPVACGVVFMDASGARHMAYLNKGSKNAIIVSAGAIGSPQLLMLSGVGPADHLRQHNISVIVDQPMVGQGMSDNPMNAVYVPSPSDVEVSLIQAVGITQFGCFIEGASSFIFTSGSGFQMSPGLLNTLGGRLLTAEARKKFFETMKPSDRIFQGGIILEKVMGPASTGELKLRNTNVSDNPMVTFNYFKEPDDLRRCVEGVTTISRVIKSKAFSNFTYHYLSFPQLLNMTMQLPLNLRTKHDNASSSIELYCKDTVMTIWHYHGGCQVGRVVDKNYKVLGVDGLRVVDGSTFYSSPGTNPQATVMMLGRYMGVKITNDRLNSNGATR